MRMGRGHIHEIDIRIGDELGVRAVGFLHMPLCCKGVGLFLRTGGNGVAFTSGEAIEGDGSLFGNPSCTDDTDAKF